MTGGGTASDAGYTSLRKFCSKECKSEVLRANYISAKLAISIVLACICKEFLHNHNIGYSVGWH